MARLNVHAVVASLAAALAASSAPQAQVAASPCDGLQEKGARLECKFDAFADEGLTLARKLREPPFSDRLSPAQLRGLRSAEDRLERDKARVKGRDLALQARVKKVRCAPRECDPEVFPGLCAPVDGDGICEAGEDCLEVVGDGVGDEQQPCDPVAGKGREVCAQSCGDAALALDDANVDADGVAELESTYDDLTRSARELNESLPAAAAAVAIGAAGVAGAACSLETTETRAEYGVSLAASMSRVGVRAATDLAERFCDQAGAGFTAGAVCVGAETLSLAAATWAELIDLSDMALDALTLDATLACATKALGTAGAVTEKLEAVRKRLDAVEETEARIRELIQTPLGQRPIFPQN